MSEGFEYEQCKCFLAISAFICDAPARSFVKNTKAHNAYHGCDKCTDPGKYISNRMTFPSSSAPLRTDTEFDEMADESHHKGPSPFNSLRVNMVTSFPLDYMHLVCLGVVRRLILGWMRGPLPCRISSRVVDQISALLVRLSRYAPFEMARKPRSLRDVDRWKATEFRQFLLYFGPIVLREQLSAAAYNNFLLLFVGIFILASPVHCIALNDYADSILKLWFRHCGDIYGSEFLVYNVHCIIHLASDVKHFGNLDCFSAFPFENYMRNLKKFVRSPKAPLAQVVGRILEAGNVSNSDNDISSTAIRYTRQHFKGPLLDTGTSLCTQYRMVEFRGSFTINIDKLGDSCVQFNNKVHIVKNITVTANGSFLVTQVFSAQSAFFTYPVNSTQLNIFKVTDQLPKLYKIDIKDRFSLRKCLIVPDDDGFVVIPMCHN